MSWEDKLAELLDKEQEILSKLTELSKNKTQALKTGDVQQLDHYVNQEQPLVLQLQSYESKRSDLLKENQMEQYTLRQIAENADGQTSIRLLKLLESFRVTTADYNRVNTLNTELTNARLEFYNYLRRGQSSKMIYKNDGKVKGMDENRALIDRTI